MSFRYSWRPAPVAATLLLLAAIGGCALHACLGPALRAGPVVPPTPAAVSGPQEGPTPASLAAYAEQVELRRAGRLMYYDPATGEEVVTHRARTIKAVIDALLAPEHDVAPGAPDVSEPFIVYLRSELDYVITISYYPESHDVSLDSWPWAMDRRLAYRGRYPVSSSLGPALLEALGAAVAEGTASP